MDFLKEIESNTGIDPITREKISFSGTGQVTLFGEDLRFTYAERTDIDNREFSNLFVSLNLPVAERDKDKFESGGQFFNTIFSGFNVDSIVIVEIPKNKYGELIDGKTFQLTIPTGQTNPTPVTLYGTYEDTQNNLAYYNRQTSETSTKSVIFGQPQFDFEGKLVNPSIQGEPYQSNIVFLFSDNIRRPKSNASLSWSTRYSTNPESKHFTLLNGLKKELFSFKDDLPVGIAYLDKGLIAITDPFLVANITTGGTSYITGAPNAQPKFTQIYYSASTSANTSYYSFNYEYVLNLLCIAGSNEFFTTTNPTAAELLGNADNIASFRGQDLPVVITEIGLYDEEKNLVAFGKMSEPIKKYDYENIFLNIRIKI